MITKMLENFARQVEESFNFARDKKLSGFDKIIVCGMGGSGIAGYVLRDIIEMPIIVNQSMIVPRWVDKKTLAFVTSYSGNTMETLEMYKQIARKTDKIVAITTGGKLAKIAKQPVIIPGGSLPKNAFHYLFFPMLNVLRNSGMLKFNVKDVLNAIKMVDKDMANRIASKLRSKIPLVYASNEYYGTAIRWKQNFNETSKQIAIASSYPEFFHNEIEGDFSKFGVVILEDKTEKRLEYFKSIVDCNVIRLRGRDKLARAVYSIHTGDYVAYHLALLNGKDPDSEARIDKLKSLF